MSENSEYSLTVFANFRIDSSERLQRMKDSLSSFSESAIDKWVINVRGPYAQEAVDHLTSALGQKLEIFRLSSKKGWKYDSRQMLNNIGEGHVFFWIEDHICICGIQRLNEIFREVKEENIEYIGYSWYGAGRFLHEFENFPIQQGRTLSHILYDKKTNKLRQLNALKTINNKSYIISCCGVFSRELFVRILTSNRPILRRWPKVTPFDFEKRWDDDYILPIKHGIPKFEIFASIDDDNKHPGSSLISRGLYPERALRSDLEKIRDDICHTKKRSRLRLILRDIPVFRFAYSFCKRILYTL